MHKRPIWILVFLVCTSCNDGAEPQETNTATDLTERVFYQSGQVPIVDVKDAPDGGRFGRLNTGKRHNEGVATQSTNEIAIFEQRPLSDVDRDILLADKQSNGPVNATQFPVVPKASNEVLTLAQSTESMRLVVGFERAPIEPLRNRLFRAEMLGTVTSDSDRASVREAFLVDKRVQITAVQDQLDHFLKSNQGTMIRRCKSLFCAIIEIPSSKLESLTQLDYVTNIEYAESRLVANQNKSPTGIEMLAGTQFSQFTDPYDVTTGHASYTGEQGPGGADMNVVIIDFGFKNEHQGFKESGGSANRIYEMAECTGSSCSTSTNLPHPSGSHGTEMAGLALGDLRDGQDSNFLNQTDIRERSGYAGEARARLYTVTSSYSSLVNALDRAAGITSYVPNVLLTTVTNPSTDTTCLGRTTASKSLNDLFDNGTLPIVSAGNVESTSTSDCTVEDPGSAISALTVGAHGTFQLDNGLESDVRNADIWDVPSSSLGSALGGTTSEGDDRSIIDFTVYGCRKYGFDRSYGYSRDTCGTSNSSATAAAAAMNVSEWYSNKSGTTSTFDKPGWTTAKLLAFGDRESSSGASLTTRFDNLWGAGRLKLRRFDSPFMDTPWQYNVGDVCVDDGNYVTIPIGYISSDSEDFKAVVWWRDVRHENGVAMDDIDLQLVDSNTGSIIKQSADYIDEKERIFTNAASGRTVELRISGWDVTSDVAGCGANSQWVYYAAFYEDDDRDDSDGPTSTYIERE